jgi:hypothetical protein
VTLCALAALVVAGCQSDKAVEVQGAHGWSWWRVAKAGAFGGYTDLIRVGAIVPRTAEEPWTAVGYTVDLDGRRIPKLWTSEDGMSWEAEGIPTDERWDRIGFAARHEGSLVVVGIRGEQGEDGAVASRRDRLGRWWRTSDGIGLLSRVGEISRGPDGLVVVGAARPADRAIALARSRDGSRWHVSLDPELAPPEGDAIDPRGYAASGSTEVVVGMTASLDPSGSPEYEPRMWWSSGGRWSRASLPPKVEFLNDVVAFRGGFVVAGEARYSRIVGGFSADGRRWKWLDIEPTTGAVLDLAVVGEKVVALGIALPHEELAVWSSRDGRDWDRVSLPAEMTELSPFNWVDATGGPGGELAIVVHDQDESEVYIGRP